jgi:hypothetical protein
LLRGKDGKAAEMVTLDIRRSTIYGGDMFHRHIAGGKAVKHVHDKLASNAEDGQHLSCASRSGDENEPSSLYVAFNVLKSSPDRI